jgi:hypothetical protein
MATYASIYQHLKSTYQEDIFRTLHGVSIRVAVKTLNIINQSTSFKLGQLLRCLNYMKEYPTYRAGGHRHQTTTRSYKRDLDADIEKMDAALANQVRSHHRIIKSSEYFQ